MFLNWPVRIPKEKGKIVYRDYRGSKYVLYETGRKYDPERKYNRPERKIIGVQISEQPELMLPNENYLFCFREEGEGMTGKECYRNCFREGGEKLAGEADEKLQKYREERERIQAAKDFFDQVYFEFQIISRRAPEAVLNENKIRRINRVLEPFLEILKGEENAEMLELIPTGEEGGVTYSDVSLLMTVFKTAINRYFQKRI